MLRPAASRENEVSRSSPYRTRTASYRARNWIGRPKPNAF